MKILYIGVHSHHRWGAEYWIADEFRKQGQEIQLLDYRRSRATFPENLHSEVNRFRPDIIFFQRGDKIRPQPFAGLSVPIIFWSTEPIQLKDDVDQLLKSEIFSWVFVHSYSCLNRIRNEFFHLLPNVSVLHNAAPQQKIDFSTEKIRFAVFNRNLSIRRRYWLWYSAGLVTKIQGRYGEQYFKDLSESHIAVNIHYSTANKDDLETGIYEAMARGCAIISEHLNPKTVRDLGMENVIIEVKNPRELRHELKELKLNPERIKRHQNLSKQVIVEHTWEKRVELVLQKMKEIVN